MLSTLNSSPVLKSAFDQIEDEYGTRLDSLTEQATLEAITLIGFCLTNKHQPKTLIRCGAFYSELLQFPVLADVLCDDSLTLEELQNLLVKLAARFNATKVEPQLTNGGHL